MRWPTMVCTSWRTRPPREPVGQLQLPLGQAGEQDTRVGGRAAAGEFCVDTQSDEAIRTQAGKFGRL